MNVWIFQDPQADHALQVAIHIGVKDNVIKVSKIGKIRNQKQRHDIDREAHNVFWKK
jgi:hypothetical protein